MQYDVKKLGIPKTIGELHGMLDHYPTSTEIYFRNQPIQELVQINQEGKIILGFQEAGLEFKNQAGVKQFHSESALHEWVMMLPFTQQALLMLSLRGPDGMSKYSNAKYILYYLRGVIIRPAYPDFMGADGFMWTDYTNFDDAAIRFFEDTDMYPMHFLMHLFHAVEVVGYMHPDEVIRNYYSTFYFNACKAFHMHAETKDELLSRLKY